MTVEVATEVLEVPATVTVTPESFYATRVADGTTVLNSIGNGAGEIAKVAPSLISTLQIGAIAAITGYGLYMILTGKKPFSKEG